MTDDRFPVDLSMPRANSKTSIGEMIRMVASTTDIGSLMGTVFEAYRLTVSLERDIIEIKSYYSNLERSNRQLHDQLMLALKGRFAERAAQIALIRDVAKQLIAEKQFDLAHSIVSQLMGILNQSPLDETQSIRHRR
jgi:hypothetical protein